MKMKWYCVYAVLVYDRVARFTDVAYFAYLLSRRRLTVPDIIWWLLIFIVHFVKASWIENVVHHSVAPAFQGSAATDLRRGGILVTNFLYRSFLNLTVEKCENRSSFAKVILKTKVVNLFLRRGAVEWKYSDRLQISATATEPIANTFQHCPHPASPVTHPAPGAGSGVVRMDPLRFLARCTRRLNQV